MALQGVPQAILSAETVPWLTTAPKHESVALDEATISNMW